MEHDQRKQQHDLHVQYHESESFDDLNFSSKRRNSIVISRNDSIKGTVLQWLVVNFQSKNLTDDHTLYYSYSESTRPAGSDPHRYIFFLYQSIDKISENKFEREERVHFSLQTYVVDN
ncbi:unnamed protein product [Rotaria socialis]|uniref:Phosphatidylethanolamine-binding protein n=1 Tax=Rotaria socialis TaxID=392032 RepID=A0A818CD70_9BILA|nr:unnamed protein product [Rotaria socialis]CAF3369806.1 unnamed protein product [Rotaria socialis]CAF3421803.1 unnamed protein product [Rotaria socialis]CAF3424761.1 unnamed protein product [Rotaria socialis]CAF3720293.1 unnamed protein product [Rotaria socialis]